MKAALRQVLLSRPWTPSRLFIDGSEGARFDFSDLSTLYQDSVGTTAGAVGQPLGMVLDKRSGMGAELWSDPTVGGAAAVNGSIAVSGSDVLCTCTVNGTYGVRFNNVLPTAGMSYRVTLDVVTNSASKSVSCDFGTRTVLGIGGTAPANGKFGYFISTTGSGAVLFYIIGGVAGESFTVRVRSVREIPGNHLTQATSTARPSLVLPTSYYAARADGVDDSLASATGGGGTAGIIVCAAVTVNGGAASARTLWSDSGTNTGYRLRINASNQLELAAGNGVAFTTVATVATLPVGETHAVTVWDDGANLNAQVDSGAVASVAHPAVSAGTSGFTLFKDNGAASSFAACDGQAFVYVKNPSAAAIAQIPLLKRWVGGRAGLSL